MTAPELTDETSFSALVERHRRELQVHCYRMLGSLEEAEDLTQETFLRAWRRRETYAGRASLRAWLYRIATNACLDALEKRPRRPSENGEVLWLQPIPDELLAELPSDADEPDAEVVARETIELAYMVAIQHLPPRSRAVLILRDALGWRARDTAELLEMSEAAVNSALQRARAGLKEHLPTQRSDWVGAELDQADRALLEQYMRATELGDAKLVAETLAEDVRFTMPPQPGLWVGRDEVVGGWVEGGFGDPTGIGDFRCSLTFANREPAVVNYLRAPGDDTFRAFAIDVLTIAEGRIVGITTFDVPLFEAFGLPATI
jgi:RNA polymerase sigma-70 factor (TIGR02960 family)